MYEYGVDVFKTFVCVWLSLGAAFAAWTIYEDGINLKDLLIGLILIPAFGPLLLVLELVSRSHIDFDMKLIRSAEGRLRKRREMEALKARAVEEARRKAEYEPATRSLY